MSQRENAHRTHPFIALLLATATSCLGNTLAALAIPWFVVSTNGNATSSTLTVAVGTVPVVIAETFGGASNLLFNPELHHLRPPEKVNDVGPSVSEAPLGNSHRLLRW
jgi:hypothetical protein